MKKHSKKKMKKRLRRARKKAFRQQVSAINPEQQTVVESIEIQPVLELPDHEISPVLEGYDETILARAKTHWFFGEWHQLAILDLDSLHTHPDRDRLALLIASAHQQLGEHEKARKFTRLAIDLGCPHQIVAQVLIAGVHNTLGRAAALKQDEARIARHFKASVAAISTKDSGLVSHARSVREMTRIGLLPQIANLIDKEFQVSSHPVQRPERQQTRMQVLESEIKLLRQCVLKKQRVIDGHSSTLNQTAGVLNSSSEKQVIVVAGMRHSGSTALFNIVRLTLEALQVDFFSCYSEYNDCVTKTLKMKCICLVKTHELRDDLLSAASTILTARRDLRDTVASAQRRGFPVLKSVGGPGEYAKYNRALHDIWLPYSSYEFVYERFMSDPVLLISEVLDVLGVKDINPSVIHEKICHLPTNKYETTLLSPAHITDPDHVLSFSDTLEDSVIEAIELQHSCWLDRYEYTPSFIEEK